MAPNVLEQFKEDKVYEGRPDIEDVIAEYEYTGMVEVELFDPDLIYVDSSIQNIDDELENISVDIESVLMNISVAVSLYWFDTPCPGHLTGRAVELVREVTKKKLEDKGHQFSIMHIENLRGIEKVDKNS